MKFRVLFLFLVGFSVLAIAGLRRIMPVSETSEPKSYGTAPAFELEAPDGTKFSSAKLQGQIWTADFFFTSCPNTCPLTHDFVRKIQEKYPAVQAVSISVDPERDTGVALAEHGEKYGADPKRWHLLRGPIDDVKKIAIGGFHLGVGDTPAMHSASVVLVDRENRVRGYFRATDADAFEHFERTVANLEE